MRPRPDLSRGKQMDRLLLPPHVTFLIGGATSSAVLGAWIPKTSVEGKYACIWCMSRPKHYILYYFLRRLSYCRKWLVFRVLRANHPVYFLNSSRFCTGLNTTKAATGF